MLTDMLCRQAVPADKERKLSDAHGLYLAVLPSGTKVWRWKYRFGGREKKLSLGSYPLISLKQARAARDLARASAKLFSRNASNATRWSNPGSLG